MSHRPPKIGIALGSGSARGWAHIGVLRALGRAGIEPEIYAGCSIGAFVGAVGAAGDLAKLADWAGRLAWRDVMGLMDASWRGGLIKGERLIGLFERSFVGHEFDELPWAFGCVATDLQSGREVWLREGSVASAVRASIALPGLMTPALHEGRVLVDGGLVNPVPVSLARAMGADLVIAVDLNADLVGRTWRAPVPAVAQAPGPLGWPRRLLSRFGRGTPAGGDAAAALALPSMLTVMHSSLTIMSTRIARSRLAGEPADVLIAPRVAQLGLMDYHRAAEAIAEGEAAVELALPSIRRALDG